MFSKMYAQLADLVQSKPALSAEGQEYYQYLKAAYPNNHNYTLKKTELSPSRELAKRYKKVQALLPKPLTSFLDIGSSKGFFVFAAAEDPACTRALGIDVYQYDIDVCRWLKKHLQNDKVQFEFMRLHELADRIEEFGGPFQTVLMLNMYQYLYFGSVRSSGRYLDHEEIFKHLRKVCNGRIIFNNRVNLADCQNVEQIDRTCEHSKNYSEAKLKAAASKYFKVSAHGTIGQYPLFTMDAKEETATLATDLAQVYDAWKTNLDFRSQYSQSPEQALESAGFQFDELALEKVKLLLEQQGSQLQRKEQELTPDH